jgi:chloramphenicol O-acetyltransferase type A
MLAIEPDSQSLGAETSEMIRYNPLMAEYLDVDRWSRRDLFQFFLSYDNPYFNICTRLDVTRLLSVLRDRQDVSVSLAYHYFALRVANEIEPFRYRLRGGKVLIHEVINGGTTVLLPNESFSFAYFDYQEDFNKFIVAAQRSVDEIRSENGPFSPLESDDRIHFTVLPWISFTSFAHARNLQREDSVPKIAFGKFTNDNERTWLPISVEVHHALMDGLHVGRFLMRLEEMFRSPEACLGPK